ncbi:MAG: hypothetical protein ACI8YQ_002853 [Polaribacter sp.]|jgi:hypothetical protein
MILQLIFNQRCVRKICRQSHEFRQRGVANEFVDTKIKEEKGIRC